MSRYRVVGAQAECEPGSDGLVLCNLLGITDPEEMEHVEIMAQPLAWKCL
jgi:hypothetical protein